jgi:hypothetical protein
MAPSVQVRNHLKLVHLQDEFKGGKVGGLCVRYRAPEPHEILGRSYISPEITPLRARITPKNLKAKKLESGKTLACLQTWALIASDKTDLNLI